MPLPFITGNVPPIGGAIGRDPADFRVEEIPAYLPSGEGTHLYVWIEKRELTTLDVVNAFAKQLSLRSSDIGVAGMKDKYAVTRQWLSLPPPICEEDLNAVELKGLSILKTSRHTNKLKTGHLKGNRFELVIRNIAVPATLALTHARSVLGTLSTPPFAPNWYGAQRFGRHGDNALRGKQIVVDSMARRKPGRKHRLMISAYQSLIFNQYLKQRIIDGLFDQVLEGDLMQVRASRGVFELESLAAEQTRLIEGDIAVTGPMFGWDMKCGAEATLSRHREDELLRSEGLTLQSFEHLAKLARGTRRSISVEVLAPTVEVMDPSSLKISFSLPAGSYATTIVRELVKPTTDFSDNLSLDTKPL